jgi:hypothetical protein
MEATAIAKRASHRRLPARPRSPSARVPPAIGKVTPSQTSAMLRTETSARTPPRVAARSAGAALLFVRGRTIPKTTNAQAIVSAAATMKAIGSSSPGSSPRRWSNTIATSATTVTAMPIAVSRETDLTGVR